jgi:hypothetical protein
MTNQRQIMQPFTHKMWGKKPKNRRK